MPIKMFVFDMAGTTVVDKNFVAAAFQKAFAKQNIQLGAEEANPLMGYEKKLAIQMMLEKHGMDPDEVVIDIIYNDFIDEMIDFYEYSTEVRAAEGAEEIFHHLKEKSITVALNTGFPRDIADTIMNRFQWLEKGLVDDYIASDEVQKGRPFPFMIQQLMARAGIEDPLLVAKVGDTAVDIEEGRNAGCSYNIAITTGAYKSKDLEALNPTHVIGNLLEIPSLLE